MARQHRGGHHHRKVDFIAANHIELHRLLTRICWIGSSQNEARFWPRRGNRHQR